MTDHPNPYAPPVAVVADMPPAEGAAFQPVKIFGTNGRIGRLRYFAYMFGAYLILGFAGQIIVIILGVGAGLTVGGASSTAVGALVIAGLTIVAITGVLNLVYFVMIGIQRSHDMNLSGGWAVLTLIPPVALGWLFVSGTKGANRFGPPPPPNSTGVKVMVGVAVSLIAISLLLMMAIAIPAYQSYVKRAQQTQSQPRSDNAEERTDGNGSKAAPF